MALPQDHQEPAQTPFTIPEIFTHILEYLQPLDLLKATGINRTARDLVHTTPDLHRAMGTTAQPGSDSRIPLIGDSTLKYIQNGGITLGESLGRKLKLKMSSAPWQCDVGLNLGCTEGRGALPVQLLKAAGLGRKMLLCIPPITAVDIFLLRRHTKGLGQEGRVESDEECLYSSEVRWVTSSTGVTIGDIVDAAVELHREHSKKTVYAKETPWSGMDDSICPGDALPWFSLRIQLGLAEAEPLVAE
ncbi:uncharacterized protein LTR77_001567 [Saxophila tyrrhenica]|uniref:F-box domain-containing protein n=1 Tax=Saxophila tyrrhenica TaxID=1690608 RepID=A0AAV9PQA1_9PEZI|nr:hypothetical protein LTR77_001567 [Saxophila tyrrhenica]